MSLAILCSGQGRQHANMFAATAGADDSAGVFAAAARLLDGVDPRDLVHRAGADLHTNRTGQILCCTQAMAAMSALRPHLPDRLAVAGYSVGELAAWGCAGVFDAAAIPSMAAARAETMDAASGAEDGLAFVRGLPRAAVETLCSKHGAAIAIVNPDAVFVLGGPRTRLEALCTAALERGAAKAGRIDVRVASHTDQLAAAVAPFRRTLAAAGARSGVPRGVRLFSGIDGRRVRDVEDGLDKLARQIATTIDWAACLEGCVAAGADTFLELGPGRALADMATVVAPGCRAHSVDDFKSMGGVAAWLAKSG